MTSELSDALNPYASQARQQRQHQQQVHSPDYSPLLLQQQQPYQYQYQYEPVVQPVQQHVPHVSELELAITEPVPVPLLPVVPFSRTDSHHHYQPPQDPNPNARHAVLTDLMHMLLATHRTQQEERQRRIAWEKEQEVKYSQRQADMEVKMVQMLDELKALRSTVNSLNDPLPNHNDEGGNGDGIVNDDSGLVCLVMESSLASTSASSSGLVSPPATAFSPASSQLSIGTTATTLHHPATPTSPIIHHAIPNPRPEPSPHPIFVQGSSTPANPILEATPNDDGSSGSPALPQANASSHSNNDTLQLSLAQAEYTISPEPDPDLETLDESSDHPPLDKSPRPKPNTGKRKQGRTEGEDRKKRESKENQKEKERQKSNKVSYVVASSEEKDDEEEDKSCAGSSSDSLLIAERRPRKRRNHHDSRCYTIHHAMRTHILQVMGLESDQELPDSHVESEAPDTELSSSNSTPNSCHSPIRFIWNKTTKQSLHNALMKKQIIHDLREHRRSAAYKHVPASEFSKKLMDAAFEQCFVTLRQKFKTQRDGTVALKVKTREEAKARKARHISRRRIKLENRSEARIKLPTFEHVIFDGALHQDCMSSEDSEIESDAKTGESSTFFRTRGYTWRSKRLLRFYAILDEGLENPPATNRLIMSTTLKRKRGMGKRERRTGPVKEAFSLPPEGVSTWMLSKRWYRESKAKYPDFAVLMRKLVPEIGDAGGVMTSEPGGSAWLGFRELGEESEDDEIEDGSTGSAVPPQSTHQDSFRVHLHNIDTGIVPDANNTGVFMNYSL